MEPGEGFDFTGMSGMFFDHLLQIGIQIFFSRNRNINLAFRKIDEISLLTTS